MALSTCDGIHGIIHIGNETYYIHPMNDAQLDGHHMILNQINVEQNASHVPDEYLFAENQMEDIVQRRVKLRHIDIREKSINPFSFNFLQFTDETISKE